MFPDYFWFFCCMISWYKPLVARYETPGRGLIGLYYFLMSGRAVTLYGFVAWNSASKC